MNTIELDRPRDAIVRLRLNRPGKMNAITWEMVEELHTIFDELNVDSSCRVIVLTGAGRGFCAGLDLADGMNGPRVSEGVGGARGSLMGQNFIASLMPKMRRIQQPIITAVNGVAYGGGLALALASDLRIASQSARFCTQFINLGLSGCDVGVSWFLPRLIGASRAHDLIMSGRAIDAAEAERYGIVTRLCEADELEEKALELAETLCDKSPSGLYLTKEVMWANLDVPSLESAIHLENRNQVLSANSGEMAEAAQAFFEKRKPNWNQT